MGGTDCKPIGEFKKMTGEEKEEYEKNKKIEQDKLEKSEPLNRCFEEAKINRKINWNRQCKVNGMNDGCYLPIEVGKLVEEIHQNARDECIHLHYQKP